MLIYKNLEIEIPEGSKTETLPAWPDEIIVNGEPAFNSLFVSAHRYGHQTKADGIVVFYRTKDGEEYEIPKTVLTDTFPGELRAFIRQSNLSQRAFAESLGVPLRTLEDWIAGKKKPDAFKKEAVLNKAAQIANEK